MRFNKENAFSRTTRANAASSRTDLALEPMQRDGRSPPAEAYSTSAASKRGGCIVHIESPGCFNTGAPLRPSIFDQTGRDFGPGEQTMRAPGPWAGRRLKRDAPKAMPQDRRLRSLNLQELLPAGALMRSRRAAPHESVRLRTLSSPARSRCARQVAAPAALRRPAAPRNAPDASWRNRRLRPDDPGGRKTPFAPDGRHS